MPTTSAQPAAVLDYAAPVPQDAVLRRLRGAALMLLCMLVCGGVGWLIDPRVYRALGYLQVEQTQRGTEQLLDVNAVQSMQRAAAGGLVSPANTRAAAAMLPPRIPLTPAEIAMNLKVQASPDSRLISVSVEHSDAKAAAAVVNAVISAYAAPGASIVASAVPPARPQQNRLYPIGGLAVGLFLGLFIAALRSK